MIFAHVSEDWVGGFNHSKRSGWVCDIGLIYHATIATRTHTHTLIITHRNITH